MTTGAGSVAVVVAFLIVATVLILIVFRPRPPLAQRDFAHGFTEDERSPFTEWSSLSNEQRKEVARLAREGRAHPDQEVERIARRWATTIIDAYESEGRGSRW